MILRLDFPKAPLTPWVIAGILYPIFSEAFWSKAAFSEVLLTKIEAVELDAILGEVEAVALLLVPTIHCVTIS